MGPLTIGQQFGSRYHILKQLGIGGMGAVYQAWDSELEVAVALKVIRPEVTRDPVAAQDLERRFKQELLLARQVTHRNVVRIHDLGEINGIKYITMSFVEGSDLSTVLRDEKLSVPRVLAIAREIAAGLQAAHEAGVVHRDLKPANVMIEHDHAIIMDFGIARSTSRGAPPPRPTSGTGASVAAVAEEDQLTRAAATVVGEVIGTIEYMAPEQARGEHVDQRADVYAFGLIVYDMLVGKRRSEHAVSAVGELQKRLAQTPPPVRTLVPAVPEALDALVTKCVEPDPAKRYQTTAELVAALDLLDDNGKLKPKKRVVGLPLMAAVIVLLLAASVGVWWYQRQFIPPTQHDPVSVIIADFQNNTSDPAFNRTLEPMLRRALESAGFVTAYDRGRLGTLGVQPPEQLDEQRARAIAANQGLSVVVFGAVDPQGNGYRVSLKAIRAVSGDVITDEQGRASSKDQVLEQATRLTGRVLNALGDDTPESDQQFSRNRISTTSLEVVSLYAAAVEASARNRFDEARQSALKAVEVDPKFGLGYMIAAVQSANLGRLDDRQKYLDLALQNLEGMTERERYLTRGYSYLAANDYQLCIKEFSEAVVRYQADVSGRNNLALCLSKVRKLREATQEMQEVVKILPNQPLFRDNLALYSNYSGDFQRGEKEALAVKGVDAYAMLARAFAQLGQGQLMQAAETYKQLAQIDKRAASMAASGLGDIAILEGRYSDGIDILRRNVADDLAAGNVQSATSKLAAISYAEMSRGRLRAAIEASDEALRHSSGISTRFIAARTFAEGGQVAKARELMKLLASEAYAEPRAYAKIVEGVLALKAGEARQAVALLREANELFDTWIGMFDLGRASLEAGLFPQADSAFDTCLNARRGEALSLFLDEEPTYAYLVPVHYYLGRAREGLNSSRFADSYREYLRYRGTSKEDPLVADLRKRMGS